MEFRVKTVFQCGKLIIMKKYFRLYGHFSKFAVMKNLAYPNDFIIWSVVDILWSVVNLGFYRIILLNIPVISGWNFDQLILPIGLIHLLSAFIWGLMYGNMVEIPKDVNKGTLDLYLTKPVNNQFLVSTRYVGLNLIPTFIIGIFLTWYGLVVNHVLSWASVLLVLISLGSAVIISYSVWFMTVTLAFWVNRLQNIAEVFPHSLDIAKYPVSIYPPLARYIFIFIIPFAFLGFVPAEIILGRSPLSIIFLPILAASVLLFLSHRFWGFALRHYSSASS